MSANTEFEVTLTTDLYRMLRREARRLGVPMRYLVASVVLDTIEEAEIDPEPTPSTMPALVG